MKKSKLCIGKPQQWKDYEVQITSHSHLFISTSFRRKREKEWIGMYFLLSLDIFIKVFDDIIMKIGATCFLIKTEQKLKTVLMLIWYDDVTQNVTLSHLVSWVVTTHIRDNKQRMPVVCTQLWNVSSLLCIMSSVNDNNLWPIKTAQWSSVNTWHGHEEGYLFSVMLHWCLQLTKTIISRGQCCAAPCHAWSCQLNCTKFSSYNNAS